MSRRQPLNSGKLRIAQRRETVAALYLAGKTQWEIAKTIELNQATVSRDLASLHAEWRRQADVDFKLALGEELARIALLEREAWSAWHESKKDQVTTSSETVVCKRGTLTRTQSRRESQCGDPRYLLVITECSEQRSKLYGLHAPDRCEINGPGGQPALIKVVEVIHPDGPLESLIARSKEALSRREQGELTVSTAMDGQSRAMNGME